MWTFWNKTPRSPRQSINNHKIELNKSIAGIAFFGLILWTNSVKIHPKFKDKSDVVDNVMMCGKQMILVTSALCYQIGPPSLYTVINMNFTMNFNVNQTSSRKIKILTWSSNSISFKQLLSPADSIGISSPLTCSPFGIISLGFSFSSSKTAI